MLRIPALVTFAAAFGTMFVSTVATADNASGAQKTALAAPRDAAVSAPGLPGLEDDTLVFTAPPRESAEEAAEIYKPIAEYLSKAIGKKVVYKSPGTWGVYRTEMLKGSYDIIFDGPHFNSYRAEKLGHNILVKIPMSHEFVVITDKKNDKYKEISDLAGRTFCAHAPPNLGTLVLLSQFTNPARQPVILNTKGWDTIYEGVTTGRCVAGVLPIANLKKLDKNGSMRIVYRAHTLPNQAFSAGPRVTNQDQAKLAAALLAPEAAGPTQKLRASFKVGERFAATTNQEYAGLSEYLRSEWGYY